MARKTANRLNRVRVGEVKTHSNKVRRMAHAHNEPDYPVISNICIYNLVHKPTKFAVSTLRHLLRNLRKKD